MLVLPLGRLRALGVYRSPTTGMLILTWRGGCAEDVRRLLGMFKHTDDLIAAYNYRGNRSLLRRSTPEQVE